jgi:hypothetical protein
MRETPLTLVNTPEYRESFVEVIPISVDTFFNGKPVHKTFEGIGVLRMYKNGKEDETHFFSERVSVGGKYKSIGQIIEIPLDPALTRDGNREMVWQKLRQYVNLNSHHADISK